MMQDSQDPILLLRIPIGTHKKFIQNYRQFGHALSKTFAIPCLHPLLTELPRCQYWEFCIKCCYTILILVLSWKGVGYIVILASKGVGYIELIRAKLILATTFNTAPSTKLNQTSFRSF
jgi:hypothetical protein